MTRLPSKRVFLPILILTSLGWPSGCGNGEGQDATAPLATGQGEGGSSSNGDPPSLAGTLDPDFGIGGKVITVFGGGNDSAAGVAVQPDGKIVVAGTAGTSFAVVRHASDGSLDPDFGAAGKVATGFAGSLGAAASGVALQPDGRIVVVGSVFYSEYVWIEGVLSEIAVERRIGVVRYDLNGILDVGFGDGGKGIVGFGWYTSARGHAVALQPDGKILVAGKFSPDYESDDGDFIVVRFNPDGSLDGSFDGDGIVTTDIGSPWDGAHAIQVQPDGKIVAAGTGSRTWGESDFSLARYHSDGSPDGAFGTDGDGVVTTSIGIGGHEGIAALTLQSDGKIFAAGYSTPTTDRDFALVRYGQNGILDASFGTAGIVTTTFGPGDGAARAVGLQDAGKIVVAGYASHGSEFDFALARYEPDGKLDVGFGGGGRVRTSLSVGGDAACAMAFQSDGKIVAAGYADNGTDPDFAVARYR